MTPRHAYKMFIPESPEVPARIAATLDRITSAPAYSPFTQSGVYRGTSVIYKGEAFTSSTGDKETDLAECRRWVRDFAFMPGGICDYGNPIKVTTETP